jgi:hypothetical protein
MALTVFPSVDRLDGDTLDALADPGRGLLLMVSGPELPMLVLKERGFRPRVALACMPGHRTWAPAALSLQAIHEWFLRVTPSGSPAYDTALTRVPDGLADWDQIPELATMRRQPPLAGLGFEEIADWVADTAAGELGRLAGHPVRLFHEPFRHGFTARRTRGQRCHPVRRPRTHDLWI